GELAFVGLGLWDERDVSLRGLDVVRAARRERPDLIVERVFATLQAHAGDTIRRDDLTLLIARS
ncbi:MAG: hypothetical protein ACLGIK_11410, partial [Gemmatimonadota bacterium]